MQLLYNPTQLTCNLTIGDFPPCTGIQKLTGFSRGWHHWNSIRLGYNRSENSDVIRLWLYTYIRGKLGYQLYPYAEIDGTEIRKPFEPDVRDLKIS